MVQRHSCICTSWANEAVWTFKKERKANLMAVHGVQVQFLTVTRVARCVKKDLSLFEVGFNLRGIGLSKTWENKVLKAGAKQGPPQ